MLSDRSWQAQHLALVTLVFPNSLSNIHPWAAPLADQVPLPNNTSAQVLPSTSNPLHLISQDSTLSYSIPYIEVHDFLRAVQEIPNQPFAKKNINQPKSWVIKASKSNGNTSQRLLLNRITDAWTWFLDLIKVSRLSFSSTSN